jgi:RimJ/RimL family protein N-acetyltransferase
LFLMARPDGLAPPDPPLSDGVVVLRAAAAGDLERLLEDGADPETQRWINISVPYTRTDAEEELERLTGCWDDADAPVALVIADATSGDYAGAVMMNHARPDGIVELGYSVHPAERGRGLAGRALVLLAPWAFAELGAARLEARTDPGNVASQRTLARAGFSREGLERGSRSIHGERRDMICWSLLPGDA